MFPSAGLKLADEQLWVSDGLGHRHVELMSWGREKDGSWACGSEVENSGWQKLWDSQERPAVTTQGRNNPTLVVKMGW